MLVCVDTIYVDSLFALNLIADYLLLLTGARVSGAVLHRWRIALASALGAAYAVASVVPEWGILTNPAAKIALGVGMCLISYGSERRFWRCTGVFFAVSALFGGAVWASGMLAGDGSSGYVVPVSMRTLALSFAVCYAAVSLLFRGAAAKRARRIVRLEVSACGKGVSLRALVDTGSSLRDPLSGRAVIVADVRSLAPVLGRVDLSAGAASAAEELSSLPGLAGRVSLVPYRAVGTASGLLAAIRPDAVTADGEALDALVALGEVRDGDYEALVPGSIF